MDTFIKEVGSLVSSIDNEHDLTKQVAERLSALLAGDYRLPANFTRPLPDRHANYPLYIAPDESWSLVCVVWNIGQRTPIHGHETWGVAGIYAGAEHEFRYVKPAPSTPPGPLVPAGDHIWKSGQVTVCCTTDDDVHAVQAVGSEPTIGIHAYGANIGTLTRPMYNPTTGEVAWFTSPWDTPA